MSAPNDTATADTASNEPIAMETSVQGTVPTAPPTIIDEYNQLTRQIRVLNQRIATIRPALTALVTTLPSQSMDTGDGRIRIATVRRSTSLTRRFVTTALRELMDHQDTTPRPAAERDALVAAAVAFIWQRRTVRTTTRLVRTWARKRRADDFMRD